ncbi:MAG: ABC transporter permease [Bacteroidetes bacterium]|nr:ABC transporter permease [Bacteroidota bacterium]
MAEEKISETHSVERSVIVTQETAVSGEADFSFRKYAWKQFKKNKPAYISLYILGFLALVSILAPVLANERPLYMKYKGQTFYPAFSFKNKYSITDPKNGKTEELQLDITNWKRLDLESVIWAPVPWSPHQLEPDKPNRKFVGPNDPQKFIDKNGDTLYMPPRFKHIMGTNHDGDDVLAGIIHGGRISLSIGFLSMGIAALLGLFLGAIAGYFGNNGYQVARARFWLVILSIPFAYFFAFGRRIFILKDAMAESGFTFLFQLIFSIFIFSLVIAIFSFLGKLISKGKFLSKQVTVPVDSYVSRSIEILNSIPTLILILSLSTLVKERSIVYVMVIIGLTSWTGIARFTRAEFLRIRSLEYIQAAQAMGFTNKRIIIRHALVNGMAPAMISIAFGVAGAILIESSLSFLHIGVPDDCVTWGKLLSEGKENFNAWWMIVYPGLAIFLVVTIYNLIGEGLRDALDPKLKK